jgi:hypothetical protein
MPLPMQIALLKHMTCVQRQQRSSIRANRSIRLESHFGHFHDFVHGPSLSVTSAVQIRHATNTFFATIKQPGCGRFGTSPLLLVLYFS